MLTFLPSEHANENLIELVFELENKGQCEHHCYPIANLWTQDT